MRKAERAVASAAIFDDPAYKRRQEAKQLRRKFNLGYIEAEHYPRVLGLLRALEQGQRLRPEDVVWLQTDAEDCWTDAVAATYHLIEAEALTETWRVTGDPWAAVNASSHWRNGECYTGTARRARPVPRNIELEMLVNGWAWKLEQYAFEREDEYAAAQEDARRNRRGIWASDNPEPPWRFKRRQQQEKRRSHGQGRLF